MLENLGTDTADLAVLASAVAYGSRFGLRRIAAVDVLSATVATAEIGTLFENSCHRLGHGHTLAPTIFLMRVHLDAEKCQGHNRCYALAPELSDVDDYGQAMLIVEGDVPTELHDKARLAASNCPEYAITITENG